MSRSSDGLSLVLPFYNEEAVAADVVDDCLTVLDGLDRPYEIILVDDGSTDGTSGILDAIAADHAAVRSIHHATNRGYGNALTAGFSAAEKELVGYIDGDGQFDPRELERLLAAIHDHDLVIGYREPRQDPLSRRAVGAGFNVIARTVLPIEARDIDCGFKLVQREVLDAISLETERTVDAELLAKAAAHGFEIVEVPVTHRSREEGVSEADGLFGVRFPLILKTIQELGTIRGNLS